MTRQDRPMPMIDSIVNDLWRSFFGAVYEALRTAAHRVGVHGVHAGRVSA